MNIEIWKDIDFNDNYEVSNLGKIRSKKRNLVLKYRFQKNGYASICINKKNHLVHRLVALSFLEVEEFKKDVNHKNAIKSDNRLENLEWVSKSENIQHALLNNCFKNRIGINNKKSRKIKQLTLEGKLIKVWDSISDVKRSLKLDCKNLVYCCKKTKYYNSVGGFKWEYSD